VSATRSGQRQIYRLEPDGLLELDQWLAPIRAFWSNRLDALETEVRRGRRLRNDHSGAASASVERSESA